MQTLHEVNILEQRQGAETADCLVRLAANEDAGIAEAKAQGAKQRIDPGQGTRGLAVAFKTESEVSSDRRGVDEGVADSGD